MAVSDYDPLIESAAREWNIDPNWVRAIMQQESGGNRVDKYGKPITSPAGAGGLMQIMPGTAEGLSKGMDVHDPPQAIYAGSKLLSQLLDKYGNPVHATMAYNARPSTVDAYLAGKGDLPAETKAYVPAVSAHYQRFAKVEPKQSAASPSQQSSTASDVPSDDDFLKATGAVTKTAPGTPPPVTPAPGAVSGIPSDEEFLKTTGAVAPPPKPVMPVLSEYGDLGAQPWATSTKAPADYAPVANLTSVAGVRNALAPEPGYVRPGGLASVLPFAFKETAPGSGEIVPGAAGYKFDPAGPISAFASPILDMLEGTGLASSVGGPNAPLAGKVSPEATAFLLGNRIGNPARNALQFGPPEARLPSPGDLRAAPLSPEFTASPLTAEAKSTALNQTAIPEAPATQTGIPIVKPPAPATPSGGMGPQSGGAAATPAYEAIHTPAEEAAYRATAEGQKLMEGQKIGEPDKNQYIHGETANSAEREQTVKAARELKELGIRVPEASQIDKAAAESNNEARRIYAENTAKGPVEITNETTKRQSDIEADKAKVFAPENVKGPVDIKPVIEHMEATLAEPFNRQNTAMKEAYRPWLERLKAIPDGVIENPEEAWGLRYDIDQQTDKFATKDNPNAHRVANRLNTAADVLDKEIENAAPGYDQMLGRYKEHSRAIDEMTVLQGALKNLRGPGQNLTYNDFQRFMKNVVDSRMTPSTDLNPYKAISDENMQRLWNIRDSLRRTASAKELAKAAGSDTMPNIIDALKAIGKMGGEVGLHAVTGSIFGPGGNVALQVLGPMAKGLNDRRLISKATRQMHRLMNPSEPLRVPAGQENPLVSPGP